MADLLMLPHSDSIVDPQMVHTSEESHISWDEMRALLGCRTLERILLPELCIWVDEDGMLKVLPPNEHTAKVYNRQLLAGTVLVTSRRFDSDGNPEGLNDEEIIRLVTLYDI